MRRTKVPPSRRRRRRRRGSRDREAPDLGRYRSIIGDWEAFVASSERPEPTVFRVRRSRVDEAALLERLERQGFGARPIEGLPACYRVEREPFPLSLTFEHWHGLFYIQQASTCAAAPALDPRPGARVLDLCAAPGGKTAHVAELMGDQGCVVSCDVSEPRIRGLLGNLYRLGHTGVTVVACDGRELPEQARFDHALVDAPCSGEGTLRRRAGRAPHQSPSFGAYVRGVQEALLRKAVRVTRPGGSILYVTCTFAPEENEAVVSAVLEDEPVRLEPLRLGFPHAPGLTDFGDLRFHPELEGAARIYPHHLDSGGLFLARLVRLDDGDPADLHDDAWRPVPSVFPGDEIGESDVAAGWDRALAALEERFGVDPSAFAAVGPTSRGGRLWLHSLAEWPLEAWPEGSWRPISVGFRAVEFDSRGRPRPTNDLLRWLGTAVTRGAVDLSPDDLRELTARRPVSGELAVPLGPVALRFDGEVIGRGHHAPDGLVGEIPKARAAELARGLGEPPSAPRASPPASTER